jgi:hypothetical protein
MAVYPGPLGRAGEWHPFRVRQQAEGLQLHSPGQRPGIQTVAKIMHPEGVPPGSRFRYCASSSRSNRTPSLPILAMRQL